jgi:hypothetical protein
MSRIPYGIKSMNSQIIIDDGAGSTMSNGILTSRVASVDTIHANSQNSQFMQSNRIEALDKTVQATIYPLITNKIVIGNEGYDCSMNSANVYVNHLHANIIDISGIAVPLMTCTTLDADTVAVNHGMACDNVAMQNLTAQNIVCSNVASSGFNNLTLDTKLATDTMTLGGYMSYTLNNQKIYLPFYV